MWRAVPSKKDRTNAIEAIKRLKTDIMDTEKLIAQAQLRLIELRKELKEQEAWVCPIRKKLKEQEAWVCPIRKLTHDELSIIFNMCAEADWTAPMHLAAVSQTWRSSVLGTHGAWSFIDLKDKSALRLLPLFLQRSGQRTFHIGLNHYAKDEEYAAVRGIADRIQCLSIPRLTPKLGQAAFPALTQLILKDETRPMPVLELTSSQFPALRHLDISCSFESDGQQFYEDFIECFAIQTLTIAGGSGLDFFHIVQKIWENLKELKVYIEDFTVFSIGYPILFPQLETLWLFDERTEAYSPIPTMKTSRLKTFLWVAVGPTQPFPIDMDLGLLTHLRVSYNQKPRLSALRGLKVFQLYHYSSSHDDLLRPLLHDQSLCPGLESIEVCNYNWVGEADSDATYSDLHKLLIRIKEERGASVRLFSPREGQLLPRLAHHHPCGDHMPCFFEW